jgi:hypothetical protein
MSHDTCKKHQHTKEMENTMGEYAVRKSDGEQVKIGTCESMYYLRYEDRSQVIKDSNSLDPATETGLFWRLPYPDEDHMQPGDYEQYNRGERLWKQDEGEKYSSEFSDPETIENPGIIQLTHPSGLLVNVQCYHGEKLPESTSDVKAFWNGRSWFYELAFVKNVDKDTVLPVVHCRHCGQMWRYTWAEILPYLHGEMKERLSVYAK